MTAPTPGTPDPGTPPPIAPAAAPASSSPSPAESVAPSQYLNPGAVTRTTSASVLSAESGTRVNVSAPGVLHWSRRI